MRSTMSKMHVLVSKATAANSTLSEQHEAFGEVVRLFQDMAYACAYAVLGDFHLAEDAAQEAFITAWQKLDQLRQPDAFPGWLRRIVLTECGRLTRGKRLRVVPLDADYEPPSGAPDPQARLEESELRQSVLAAVKSLPPNERMVATLFYLSGHTHKDIGEFLEVPTTTIAKRLFAAKARLKHVLMGAFKDSFARHRPSCNASFAAKVKAGIFDAYVGLYRYELRPELLVTISKEGDRLFSEAAGQRNELAAAQNSETKLRTREFDGKGKFVRNKRGQVTHFIYYEFGQAMGRAVKIG